MMDNDLLLKKSIGAQDQNEYSWIIIENLLSTLSPELVTAVWAAVVPHWFNAEILGALCPELLSTSSQLYMELQALPFVEEVPGRGHNVRDLTRNLMLERLHKECQNEFQGFSQRAVKYFSNINSEPENRIEWLYHLIVVDDEWKGREFWNLAQQYIDGSRISELQSLVAILLEQIAAKQVNSPLAIAEVNYWIEKITNIN